MSSRRKTACVAALILAALCMAAAPVALGTFVTRPIVAKKLRAWWAGAQYMGEDGVIRQRSSYDCGTACLQMVLTMKGITVPSERLQAQAGTTRTGTSLLGLGQAAEANQMKATPWRLGISNLAVIPLPAVAFVNGDHFVVVTEVARNKSVVVLDPARGKLCYTLESFAKHWRGEILVFGEFNPTQDYERKTESSVQRSGG